MLSAIMGGGSRSGHAMLRCAVILLVIPLALAGCTRDGDSTEATVGDSFTTIMATTTAAESSTTTTTAVTITTTTIVSTTTTTTTLPPVTDVEAGLFCRDLFPLGYDYASVVTYWVREGSPDRMDADRNGIPCETVYPEADVLAFWGDSLPTTTAAPSQTLTGLESYVGEQWQGARGYRIDWVCRIDKGTDLSAGAVASCQPTDIGEGEYPVLTALVLDGAGTVAVTESGLLYAELFPDYLTDIMGSGKLCRDVLNPDIGLPDWIDDPGLRYFGAVLYWFMEGRPDRMDADVNGIPCETLVSVDVVARFWDGGWVGDTW
jgi:hypothetical protein